MKLKSILAPSAKTAESHPLEKSVASVRRTLVSSDSPALLTQPFESFVRSLVATKQNAQSMLLPRPAGTQAEEVIAQADVDGVRYMILRYELSSPVGGIALSPREREIVSLIAKGFPNKAIADVLEISTWTVGTHLRRIFAKMGVTCRAAMVAKHLHGIAG